MSAYLEFRQTADSGKTKRYAVISRHHGDVLAEIAWYGPWRQYTVEPMPATVWNRDCLREVAAFIEGLQRERADARRASV